MAGRDPGFDRAAFEAGIRFAMTMGAPPDPAAQATFHFKSVRGYPPGTLVDSEGTALDPSIRATVTTAAPVRAECAVEFDDAAPDELPIGVRVPTRMNVTLLDAAWQRIRDAVAVTYGGDRYVISHRLGPYGLFDAAVHQLIAYAEAES